MADQFKEAFKEETNDIIAGLNNLLVDLESSSVSEESKIILFRHLHTIKGGAGMFGYTHIASFVHELETILDPYKQGEIQSISSKAINYLLKSMDFIKFLMDTDERDPSSFQSTRDELIESLKSELGQIHLEQDHYETNKKKEEEVSTQEEFSLFRIDLTLSEHFLYTGNRPHYLLSDLAELGEVRIFSEFSKLPILSELDTAKFYIRWVILMATFADKESLQDVFVFLDPESKASILPIKNGSFVDMNLLQKTWQDIQSFGFENSEIQDILESAEILEPLLEELESNKSKQNLKESSLVEAKNNKVPHEKEIDSSSSITTFQSPGTVGISKRSSSVSQINETTNKGVNQNKLVLSSIRVDSKRLDHLVDLVGELVTTQARIYQKLQERDHKEMESAVEKLDFVLQELRDVTTNMRMIPIQGTFSKFQRLVRDLSQELGKKVDYITEGGETELDKNIIEKLDEPLVHLIRNALDHGIETPEERLAKGKEERAFLKLTARQNGANISIQIQEDGSGLNKDLILQRAIERGLVSSGEGMRDEQIFNLIFESGFSTAEQVTNLSGRGVGMNVVKSQVESLRGSISLKTEQGKGTSFSLIFPLTLAIIDGFLVRVDKDFFVIPLSVVEACLELQTKDLQESEKGGGFLSFRGKVLPSLSLRHFFEIGTELPISQQIVVVETDQTMIGIVVDEVIGKHQTVIKSLGEIYRNVKGVSSATILGDGNIALILDIEAIVALNAIQAKMEHKELQDSQRWVSLGSSSYY